MTIKIDTLPRHFVWRRLHSLTGLWLVIFLIEHMLTNSQAALLLGDSGQGFVRMVNALHNLPYLTVIEVGLLGIPLLIHAFWGVIYAFSSGFNSMRAGGDKPHLRYGRNKAYTWQRITSWVLLILLAMHIVKFRFLSYPQSVNTEAQTRAFITQLRMDPGLYTVAHRLGVTLYDKEAIDALCGQLMEAKGQRALMEVAKGVQAQCSDVFSPQDAAILQTAQSQQARRRYIEALAGFKLKKGEVLASSPSFGTASLLGVRDTFKSPLWVGVYTVFVLCAVFHAFNGLWTSVLTWGWVIRASAQTRARKIAIALMCVVAFLGLSAVWGTYFLNLRT